MAARLLTTCATLSNMIKPDRLAYIMWFQRFADLVAWLKYLIFHIERRRFKFFLSLLALFCLCAYLARADKDQSSDPASPSRQTHDKSFQSFRLLDSWDILSGGVLVCGLLTIILIQQRAYRLQNQSIQLTNEKAEQFRRITDSIPTLIMACDSTGSLLFWNKAGSELTGYAPQRILGHRGIWTLLFPDPSVREVEMALRISTAPSYTEHISVITCADGSKKTISWSNHSVQTPISGWHSWESGTDITSQADTLQAFKKQESFQQAFFNSLNCPLWLKDHSLRFCAANTAFCKLVGHSEFELLGQTAQDAHVNESMIFSEMENQSLHSEEPIWLEKELVTSHGAAWYQLVLTSVRDISGNHIGVSGIAYDLTTQRSRMHDLERARNKAETANKTKNVFLADMSHEIRTPLSGVLGMLELIQSTPLTEEQSQYAQIAINASKRLSRLLADILDLSRIEAGQLEIIREVFSLTEIRSAILDTYQITAKQKNNRLHLEIVPNVPQRVHGDATRLRQILFNLIGNALKFTSKGEVGLHLQMLVQHGRQCTLLFTVYDTGPGIPDQLIETIFDPFIQQRNSLQRHEGVGLGLAIVKRLVHLMNGTLAISSTLGEGTEICFTLPFEIAPEQATPQPLANGQSVRPLKILVAEDDKINQMAIIKLLEKNGHLVTCVENGIQVLDTIKRISFDVILMDVQMPDMDGIETTRHIRLLREFEAVRNIPIIALTACAMSGDRERFIAAGMNDYIAKPVDWNTLNRMIRQVMNDRKQAES